MPFLEKCSSPVERKTYYQFHCCFWASLGKPFNMAAGRTDELPWSRVGVPASSSTSARAASRAWGFSDRGQSSPTKDLLFLRHRAGQTLQRLRMTDVKRRAHLRDPAPALSETLKSTQTSQSLSSRTNKTPGLPEQSSARPPADGAWGGEQKAKTTAESPQERSQATSPITNANPHCLGERGEKHWHLASLRFNK